MARIYLASSFSLTPRVKHLRNVLTAHGHSVPDVWWLEDLKELDLPDDELYQHPRVREVIERHWRTIPECDALVLVAPALRPKTFTGANIELGYALGHGVPCFAWGKLERSGMYSPVRRVDELSHLLKLLELLDADLACWDPGTWDPGSVHTTTCNNCTELRHNHLQFAMRV